MLFCFLICCAVKSMHQARFIQLRNHNKRIVQLQLYLPATRVHKDAADTAHFATGGLYW